MCNTGAKGGKKGTVAAGGIIKTGFFKKGGKGATFGGAAGKFAKFGKKGGFKKIGGAGFSKKFGVVKKFGSVQGFKFGKAGGFGLAGGAAGAFGRLWTTFLFNKY
jgi:hypothetical protein